MRILSHVFYIFPVKKNRILFSSFEGGNYGCSPKYIFEYMYENYGDSYEYVWCINDKNKNTPKIQCAFLFLFNIIIFVLSINI